MKLFLLSAVLVSVAALGACQSSDAPMAASRTFEVTGAQARYSVQIPENTATASAAPFALQGSPAQAPVAVPTNGYQSR